MTATIITPLFQLNSISDLFGNLPITNHVWVFFIVLSIILFAPMIFNRLRIPHLIGMILAGVLVGENGLNILERDDSFQLFGQVGIYYIMFLAGLEMDLAGLKQNQRQGLTFGVLTALIPFVFGLLAGLYVLSYSVAASVLLACIFASHTLVAYPIVGRYGLARNNSVVISVAATMVALLLALLTIAGLAGIHSGDTGLQFWLWFTVKFAIFFSVIFIFFPRIIRWFLRKYTDQVMLFTFVLAMVFLAGAVAEACGIEGILGAFLAGLVANRYIPRTTPLMMRLEFVGNAIFIPYFLIGVGMLVNLTPLFTSPKAVEVVAIIVIAGTLSKYIAAVLSRRIFKLSRASGLMMFGLTEAHAAGALAMVMVGRRLEVSPGVPLMDNAVLDGVVVMILISCIISSIATDQAARSLKIEEKRSVDRDQRPLNDDEKILVPINEPSKIEMLVHTALIMRNTNLNRGLIFLNVVNDDDPTGLLRVQSKDCLQEAERLCAAADVKVQTQSRLAVNFVNGVVHAFRENDASEIIIGLHHRTSPNDSMLGRFAPGLVNTLERQIIIVNLLVPINTLRSIVVAVPERAQFEAGFTRWLERISRMAVELGCRICFHATEETAEIIRGYLSQYHPLIRDEYSAFDNDASLEEFAVNLNDDHLFVLVTARHGAISYERRMAKMQFMLRQYFTDKNLMIIYPEQGEANSNASTFINPHIQSDHVASGVNRWLSKWIGKIG